MNADGFPHSPSTGNSDEQGRDVLSVSELNAQIRDSLQGQFGSVWVSGEVSDLSRPQSGHIYLSLKDGDSQMRAVAWRSVANRLRFDLEDGMQICCEGHVDVYPPRGTYQLILRKIEPVGMGALQLALIQLQEKLTAQGLFDPARKQALPVMPKQVAVVTSPTGAAVRDFLEVIRRRWPLVQITIVPTRVQGADAAPEIVAAIRTAERLEPDVVVVTRGGGSVEDLWCFNDESVVRAIFDCHVPVVSAIGHEIDVTLSDMVADLRALTPTEAAERLVPDRLELKAGLQDFGVRLRNSIKNRFDLAHSQLSSVRQHPVFQRPFQRIQDRTRMVDELSQRLDRVAAYQIERKNETIAALAGKLETLSPLLVLARGYSLTQTEDAEIIKHGNQVTKGDTIVTRLSESTIQSRVEQVDFLEEGQTPG